MVRYSPEPASDSYQRLRARFYWPNEDAVGKVLTGGDTVSTVVGVVDDVHEDSLEGEPGWQGYYPATQDEPSGA